MFLNPIGSGPVQAWPGEVAVPGGTARVMFIDGVPVLDADGGARFEIRRRRRALSRPKVETVSGARAVPVDLRRGDVVALVLGGRDQVWTYDPDGNLGRWARLAMRGVRAGTVAAVLAGISVVLGTTYIYQEYEFYGGGSKHPEMAEFVRMGRGGVYPTKERGPSEYLRVMIKAHKEGIPAWDALDAWMKAHPKPQTTSVPGPANEQGDKP